MTLVRILFLTILLLLTSCQSFDQVNDLDEDGKPKKQNIDYGLSPPELTTSYEKGVRYLDNQDYQKAAKQFEYLITKYPTSPLTMALYYNAAAAYEGLKNCKRAGKNFRKIVRATNEENKKIQTMALVRLSYAYECLAADKKVVTSLLDAKNRKEYLQNYVVLTELPARLAGAYGRLGNQKVADKFFQEADQGLYQVRDPAQTAPQQRDALAQSLFYMGRYWYNGFRIKRHENILKTFEKSQMYLVRAMELDSPKWSAIAAKNLIEVYQFLWVYLNKAFDNGEARGEKVTREQANSLAIYALQGLRTLKRLKLPDRNPPTLIRKVYSRIDKFDKDYSDFLTKNNLGTKLTDLQKNKSLKREGRTVNPDPRLEKIMREMKKQKNLKVKPSN